MESEVQVKKYLLRIPVAVEAEQVTPDTYRWIASWCKGTVVPGKIGLWVPTPFGIAEAFPGDYVVKKMTGDFKILSAEHFERKYILLEMGPKTND